VYTARKNSFQQRPEILLTHLEQEAFEKCWAHSPREPPHAQSAGVATGTVACRLRIDVHDDNDNA